MTEPYHDRGLHLTGLHIAFQRIIDGREPDRGGELRNQTRQGIPNCGADYGHPLGRWFDLSSADKALLSTKLGLPIDALHTIATTGHFKR